MVWASTLGSKGSWFASVHEATSFSHIFGSKWGVHSRNAHITSLFSMSWEITANCFFLSVCHRFGFCLTLKLYGLSHCYLLIYFSSSDAQKSNFVILMCTTCWMFVFGLFIQEQTSCQTYQVNCSDSSFSLFHVYL